MKARYPDALPTDLIRHHTHQLADLVASADLATPVPTCGDWTMADLAHHLYEVQHFWAHIIGNRPAGPEDYSPPAVSPEPAAALRSVAEELVGLLDAADPGEEAWSWSSNHTVGFTMRRQVHEALIHHIDGVVATGSAMPMVAGELAADGIDEMVDVMLTGIPDWATFVPSIEVVQLYATDTDDRWTMSLGSISGTSTQTGTTYDGLPAADRTTDDQAVDLTIAGSGLDVLLWLWGRAPIDRLELSGDATIADTLRTTVINATQ